MLAYFNSSGASVSRVFESFRFRYIDEQNLKNLTKVHHIVGMFLTMGKKY